MSFEQLTDYLKLPYRREYHPVYSTLIITLLVLFLIAALKPFGIAKASMIEYLLILISTAVGVISGMLIAHYLIPSLFKSYYASENWTIGKDILHIVFSVFVVGITNGAVHGICQVLYQDASMQNFTNVFTELFVAALILSPVPVFVLAIMNYNRSLAFSLNQMQGLNALLVKKDNGDSASENDALLTIAGDTKEQVILPADAIRFIEACGNYIKINYLEDNNSQQKILRTTIRQVENILTDYSFIIRCHRSFLVNIHHVAEVKGNSKGYRFIIRYTNQKIPISRAYAKNIKEKMG
ncbi:MAG: LytTR family transcriptional regulator [Tannerella sp.]|jgi:hypothetical protein|nr:LytTR family transcriptional regulator [Tannerella sp.]